MIAPVPGPRTARRGESERYVAVVAAMPDELHPLSRRLRLERTIAAGAVQVKVGRLAGRAVALAAIGEGSALAASGTEALFSAVPVDRLVVIGIAGGLAPDLRPGQIVVAREVRGPRGTAPGPDGEAAASVTRSAGARPGVVWSDPDILWRTEQKRAAWEALGSAAGSVVDLETAACAGVAAAHGVPYVALRVVCDTAGENLPLDLNDCRGEDGAVSRLRVVRRLLGRPAALGGLWELRRRMGDGADRLAAAIVGWLEQDGEIR